MTEQIIKVEAESLEEARAQVLSQISKGFYLLSEQVISDGKPKTVKAVADTTELALAKAQSEIPTDANVLSKEELLPAQRKVIMLGAVDEEGARASALSRQIGNTWIIKSLKLTTMGKKGFLGIGEKPNQYEVELLQQALVQITYKTKKVKISAKIDEKKEEAKPAYYQRSTPLASNVEGNYVQRCLEPQFQEKDEPRTWRSDPVFRKVLDPLNDRNYETVCKEAENLIVQFRDFDLLYKWWGSALIGMEAYDQARNVLHQGLESAKRLFILCATLGENEWKAGNIKEAVYWWAQALHCQETLKDYGGDVSAYLYLHYIASGVGFPSLATAFISRVDRIRRGQIRLEPFTAENLRNLAQPEMEPVLSGLASKYRL